MLKLLLRMMLLLEVVVVNEGGNVNEDDAITEGFDEVLWRAPLMASKVLRSMPLLLLLPLLLAANAAANSNALELLIAAGGRCVMALLSI